VDRRHSSDTRVEKIIGLPFDEFIKNWISWLSTKTNEPLVHAFLQNIPSLTGHVSSRFDSDGIHRMNATYELIESDLNYSQDLAALSGTCSMKHDYIGPFDAEFELLDDYEDITFCQADMPSHSVDSFYGKGDRAFVALDYQGGDFHQPLRLHAERLTIR
jgi:hypothetical protein